MTCGDYMAHWNDCLDAATPPSPILRARWIDHEANCPDCRRLGIVYEALSKTLPTPRPSSSMAGRILSAWEHSALDPAILPLIPRWRRSAAVLAVLAASAVIAAVVRFAPPPARVQPEATPASRPWDVALADAASATLELARETSAPVARIGQDVLVASRVDRDPTPSRASGTMVESVSRNLSEGIRPIEGTARRAFSFLLAPERPAKTSPSRDPGA